MRLALIEEHQIKEWIREAILELSNHVVLADDQPMNQKEAAKFLDVSEVTIINWKKQGKIPYEQLPGSSKVRFYKSQLKAVVQKNPHLLQPSRK